MTEKDDKEPTQETPGGHTIPVPKRDDVLRALEKVARRGDSSRPEPVPGNEPEDRS